MVHKMLSFVKSNFSKFAELNPQPGDVFEMCNFAQPVSHTKIPDSYEGLTFQGCNLINIDPPADAILLNSPNSQWDRCSHLHPNWDISQCVDNCDHVVDTDEVWIDGILIDTIYHYSDGRL